jgi:hypothetical protein
MYSPGSYSSTILLLINLAVYDLSFFCETYLIQQHMFCKYFLHTHTNLDCDNVMQFIFAIYSLVVEVANNLQKAGAEDANWIT